MECKDAQALLLEHEFPLTERRDPGALADHIARCGDCRALAAELARLEAEWRAIPLPSAAAMPSAEFLDRFAAPPGRPLRMFGGVRRFGTPRRMIAASILVALAAGGTLFVSMPRASASSDVVERLVDWNLELAGAPSHDERDRIYAGGATRLATEVARANLAAEDQELAQSLLATAPWLARNADPLAEAGHFDDVADKLLKRMNRETRRGDAKRIARSARLYQRVVELGIESKLDVIKQSGALDFDRQRNLERLILRDADRLDAVLALLERAPDSTRKEIKRALKVPRARPKKEAERPAERKAARKPRPPRKAPTGTAPARAPEPADG
jgi:hypothetical protein